MKYDYKEYESPLSDDMKDVEIAYRAYQNMQSSKELYDSLKETIYLLSLTLKMAKISGYLNTTTVEEMNDYYWGLLLW